MKTTSISEKISTNVATKEQEEQEEEEYNEEESSCSNEAVETVPHHKTPNGSNFFCKLKRNIANMSYYKWLKVAKKRKEEKKKQEEKEKERQRLCRHENDRLYREAIAHQTQRRPQARRANKGSSAHNKKGRERFEMKFHYPVSFRRKAHDDLCKGLLDLEHLYEPRFEMKFHYPLSFRRKAHDDLRKGLLDLEHLYEPTIDKSQTRITDFFAKKS